MHLGVSMTVSLLATGLCPSVACTSRTPGSASAANRDRFSCHASIEALISAAREQTADIAWAAYAAGELKCLLGQGDNTVVWPVHIAAEDFEAYCAQLQLHCRVAGQGEGVLGWVLAPMADKDHPLLVDLAARLGSLLQTAALIRAQNTQRVLYEISLLASSTLDRGAFLQGIHEQLGALIDAENFYVALYDRQSGKITYPYYIDRFDDEAMAHETFEFIDADRMSLTGYVLSSGQPLFLDAACIELAKAENRFYCVGRLPEFWMGAPLKNASDEVFGMVAMQVYDVSRVYSAQDRALFAVVSRHVAMALDRQLRRTDLEQVVALRTQQLSAANDALRQEVRDRERAEHLQSALFQIAELSSQPGDMNELFRSLHMIVGELLVALNFYIALYDSATGEVTFPYYIDEFKPTPPRSRRGQRGFTEYVIGQRRPCLIDYDEARRLESLGEIEVQRQSGRCSSWLGIPLFDGGQVRGVLVVQSYSKDVSYTLRDQELLTFVSRHIDTALSRRSAADAIHTANVLLEARVRDRTRELDRANARLQHENSHDSLTGLPNRSHLQYRLRHAWQDFCRDGQQLIVMFIDLDRFKMINDSLGHHCGDILLVQAAERLRSCMREKDLLARLGGDEFAVLSIDTPLQTGTEIAQRILTAFEQPFVIDDHTVFSSCSIGVVGADSRFHQEPADLLRDADTAMYRVKNGGRDSFAVFNQALRREVSDQVEQEGALRTALKRTDQLIPYFQPVICVNSGKLLAFEALIRWCMPDGRVVGPESFLPALEGLRLIGRLDFYMLKRVVAILAQPENGHWPPVHVNCSSYSITRPAFAAEVLAMLAEHNVAPERLCLELTEGALVADPEQARLSMKLLAEHGMSVMLDDFGAGFSSLSYVHQYHFSGLKIDKSFIFGLASSVRSRAIVRAIVRMAESLDLTVVAEGVEDRETLELLREIGATQAQGYYFSEPLPIELLNINTGRAAG
ncbi:MULTISPECIES: bifunctional diguanylate cyclase/phosphodiesterase [Pseudomonas]|jgi:diguanylate cyclase (GGDEF)-like protein|uniref:bifunctional diguanylate cyclase/phosphodiesterase n=1 Tax=Pseudomonas TaxID=286 RepID=UPI0007C4728A|nr:MULTISPECIES: EAL domain-containing protein [Pseudomonas]MBC8881397.1 EAL domain-containing protein [Pseudomonas cerasi]MBC9741356.1 EAL domain-containing protein [Pseudomonas syringae pv. syringae]MBC9748102.1 EAL domain-containing protein [Pseudomonas syringae pv. syringae]MCK9720557.1 EAL domain-containing protein [Pseudomonas syringae pv. syringae]MCK9776523.1 EAL domain-containing protein [Pseudomonas syringae pv. syringae]